MRHLLTMLLCLLPALALGQSAVTVRGPAGTNAASALSLPGTPVLQADGSTLVSAEDGELASVTGSPSFLPMNGRWLIKPGTGVFYWSNLAKPATWSVAAVFRSDALASQQFVMGGYNAGSATAWGTLRVLSAGAIQYQFGDGSVWSVGQSPNGSIVQGQWHTVVVTYAGGGATQATIYIDGASVAVTPTATDASSTAGTAPPFGCGGVGDATGNEVTYIAACIAWDAALDASQAAAATATLQAAFGLD